MREAHNRGVSKGGFFEASLLGLHTAPSYCLRTVSPLCAHPWCLSVSKSLLIRTPVLLGQGPPVTSFTFITSVKIERPPSDGPGDGDFSFWWGGGGGHNSAFFPSLLRTLTLTAQSAQGEAARLLGQVGPWERGLSAELLTAQAH